MVHIFCNLEEIGDDHLPMCDMTFEIVEKTYDASASSWRLIFRADATPYDPIGFGAIIPASGWREQITGEGDDAFHTFWGPVTLYSHGVESDRLLTVLADYYGISAPSIGKKSPLDRLIPGKDKSLAKAWKFVERIECLAVGINSNPALIADEMIYMKLFLEDGIEDGRYAELFFNIDMPQGFAALNEKDEEYRADLVHWLSLPGNVSANPSVQ
jgi:hypothetical protein